MQVTAIDFETFYDSADGYSLTDMTPWDYVHDKRFDPYLVSIGNDAGLRYVGDPAEFDWKSLSGHLLVAHNMAFDGLVLRRMIELGTADDFPRTEHCTADLAAYLAVPRNLKGAVQQLYGVTLSKKVRTDMNGKTLADTRADGTYHDLLAYADSDQVWCLRLWHDHSDKWPEWEREVSRINREACWRGVRINRKYIQDGLAKLRSHMVISRAAIPWVEDTPPPPPPETGLLGIEIKPKRKKKKPVAAGSTKMLSEFIRAHGMEPPSTFNKNALEYREFAKRAERECEAVAKVLKASSDIASLGQHIARLEMMLKYADDQDMLRFSLRYYGAHTGRNASGEDKDEAEEREEKSTVKIFNPLNLSKEPVFGVDMRGTLLPRPGYRFVILDFAQIEARVILWLAKHKAMLDSIDKSGGNLYVAYGVLIGKVKFDEVDTKDKMKAFKKTRLYDVLKAVVLAMGFGQGPKKFRTNTEQKTKGAMVFTAAEAKELTYEWRNNNRPVCDLWNMLGGDKPDPRTGRPSGVSMRAAIDAGRTEWSVTLPSGRVKRYYDVHMRREIRIVEDDETGEKKSVPTDQMYASFTKGGYPKPVWGGVLAQHATQATARDIMDQGSIEVVRAMPHVDRDWTVYDEMIFEAPEATAEQDLERIKDILCDGVVARTWAKGLPLAVDSGIFDRYVKM